MTKHKKANAFVPDEHFQPSLKLACETCSPPQMSVALLDAVVRGFFIIFTVIFKFGSVKYKQTGLGAYPQSPIGPIRASLWQAPALLANIRIGQNSQVVTNTLTCNIVEIVTTVRYFKYQHFINNTSFSSELTNGPNKLECYITLGLKGLEGTTPQAYWAHLYVKK